jgi:hypothetical protein
MTAESAAEKPARRAWLAVLVVAAITSGLASTGAAQGLALRSENDFVRLEDELLQAMRARDRPRLESLLAEDFEMFVAQLPLDSISRDAWIDNLGRPGSRDVAIRSLVTRELEPDLAHVSLWLVPEPARAGRGKVFVLDTWQRREGRWQLIYRHAAPVAGSRLWIPGDSGRAPFRKMI